MVLKEFDIGGNSAIVTGAARGLGKAIALTLAEAGADVAVADFREEVEETAREIRELGRKGIAVRTDVREAEQVEHMVQAALAEFGKVDIMVANAGVEWVKPLLLVDGKPPVRMRVDVNLESGLDEEDWNRTLDEAHEAALYRISSFIPLQRDTEGWGRPRELGLLVAFLASEAASYITGHVLVADGGVSL